MSIASFMSDFTKLEPWIQPHHLRPEVIGELARRFQADPDRCLVLDDFLVPERVAAIRDLVMIEGRMKPVCKLYGEAGWVDEAEFRAAPDGQQFIFEEVYVGAKPGREMGRPALLDAGFRKFVDDVPFLTFLSTIVGRTVSRAELVSLKRLGRNHLIRKHDDAAEGRVACMVLYLHERWHLDNFGRFVLFRNSGDREVVEPLTNRLILFDPHAGTQHEVERIGETDEGWMRINYTVWFH